MSWVPGWKPQRPGFWAELESRILAELEKVGEVKPPVSRLAQEWFWIAAGRLQSRGLCVADQRAAVVKRVAP